MGDSRESGGFEAPSISGPLQATGPEKDLVVGPSFPSLFPIINHVASAAIAATHTKPATTTPTTAPVERPCPGLPDVEELDGEFESGEEVPLLLPLPFGQHIMSVAPGHRFTT